MLTAKHNAIWSVRNDERLESPSNGVTVVIDRSSHGLASTVGEKAL